jgi:hypothetical protein
MLKIPEIPLVPAPETDEARAAVGYKWNDFAGKRHRLGGEPMWAQSPDHPSCPGCRELMTFYGQLDSIGDDYDLADCGLIYVFVCFDCFETACRLQSH